VEGHYDFSAANKFTAKEPLMRSMIYSLPVIAFGLFTLVNPAFSADDDATLYDVEVIIFDRSDEEAGVTEIWPDDPGEPDWESLPAPGTPDWLPDSAWKLGPEDYTLRHKSRGLKTHIHAAWRQVIRKGGKVVPIRLRSSQTTVNGMPVMEGLVSVSVKRYLHVNLDMTLRIARVSAGGESKDGVLEFGDRRYRMQEHRRMRSGELHYLDHPMMGVLIRIDRSETGDVSGIMMEPLSKGDDSSTETSTR
jgi:hypothetical protein